LGGALNSQGDFPGSPSLWKRKKQTGLPFGKSDLPKDSECAQSKERRAGKEKKRLFFNHFGQALLANGLLGWLSINFHRAYSVGIHFNFLGGVDDHSGLAIANDLHLFGNQIRRLVIALAINAHFLFANLAG
jgi:hypothetical protein